MFAHRVIKMVGLILAVLFVGACASSSSADEGAATLDLPPVESEATLTVVGGSEKVMTFADLEALPMHEISIVEPFIEEETVFQGPRLADVFDLAGITAGDVEVLAINDYGYTLSVADWGGDALLATRENGQLIDLDTGGPFRVVAADGTTIAADLGAWVWSIDRLVVG